MPVAEQLTIALLVGGASPERAVSKLTAKGVYNSLLELGYKVKLIDPSYGTDQPNLPDDFFAGFPGSGNLHQGRVTWAGFL